MTFFLATVGWFILVNIISYYSLLNQNAQEDPVCPKLNNVCTCYSAAGHSGDRCSPRSLDLVEKLHCLFQKHPQSVGVALLDLMRDGSPQGTSLTFFLRLLEQSEKSKVGGF